MLCAGCVTPDRAPYLGSVPASDKAQPIRTAKPALKDELVEEESPRAGSALEPSEPSAQVAEATDVASKPGVATKSPSADTAAIAKAAPDTPPDAVNPQLDRGDLAAVLKELESLGTLEPAAQQKLMQDLQKTDPALWPQIVTMFKATLAYQRKLQSAADGKPVKEPAGQPIAKPDREPERLPQVDEPPARLAKQPGENDGPKETVASAPLPARAQDRPIARQDDAVRAASFERPAASEPPTSNEGSSKSLTAEDHLQACIAALEAESRGGASTVDSERHLRVLYVLANRRDDALRPINGLAAAQQDFWSKQLYGLGSLLEANQPDDHGARAAEAAQHLSDATARLRESASLVVCNLAFCTEVSSYGVYKQFENYAFRPAQEVLLYAEVENFKSETTPEGYKTALTSRYELFDKQGNEVDEKDFGATEDVCRNRRRDFFIRYQFALPKRLYNGSYTLKLTVEDKQGEKIGQSTIDFAVKGASE